MLVAARGLPSLRQLLLIVLCMVFARTAAMLFNRLADWEIDQRNPRTAARHRLVPRALAVGAFRRERGALRAATAYLNPLCLWLSPVALAIVCFTR